MTRFEKIWATTSCACKAQVCRASSGAHLHVASVHAQAAVQHWPQRCLQWQRANWTFTCRAVHDSPWERCCRLRP